MWTVAIVIGLVGIGVLLSFFSKSFSEDKVGIRVLFLMFGLLITIILSKIMDIIIKENSSGSMLDKLSSLSSTVFIVLVTLFSFFIAYFLITYTVSTIKAAKEAKRKKWKIE